MHHLIGQAPASLINLNGPGNYISWGVVQLSWANAVVIMIMLVIFALALLLPFPGSRP